MPRIHVEFSALQGVSNQCNTTAARVDTIESDFRNVIRQLDWDIKYESNINGTASQISRKLEKYSKALKQYRQYVDEVSMEYKKLDEYKRDSTSDSIIKIASVEPIDITIVGPGCKPFANWMDRILELFGKDDEDLMSTTKTILKGTDKFGKVSEAGILEDVLSYLDSFYTFFTGDKRGITGASNWCDLANSSISVWNGVYDYFQKKYDGLKTGFFGEIAQKNVKVMGLSASFLGLTSSILSASNNLNEKQWQSIVADYVDCGKDMVSVIKSGYELKHLGDIKSLAGLKAGPWSALSVYSAIGEAGVQAVSQGFRSQEKYSADGNWDVGDTGATGIDVSMAGVYGISHSLTFGFDDFIFNAIYNATGGEGKPDMSYFEMAAEGYKILGQKCGDAIANWWIGLTK